MEINIIVVDCKNCGNKFSGKFCNHCGQSADTHRIGLKFILTELKKTFIQFNSGFFYTVKQMFVNPGNFIKKYLEGKRVSYAKPFSYLIITCGLNVLLYHYMHVNIVLEEIEGLNKDATNDFIMEHYMQIQLAILPVYAFVSILFFKQKVYNFFEFIIIHTYLAGQRILINLLIILLEGYFNDPSQMKVIMNVSMLVTYGIMIWTYINLFSEQPKIKVALKTVAIEVVTFLIILLLAASFVLGIR